MPQIQRETGTSLSEINMVPFIDVVLVLLIIFMITAPILQSGIDVDVPKTKTVKELTEVRMVVTIDRGQRVYLNDKPVNIHEIGQQVVAQSHDPRTRPSTCGATRRCRSEAGPPWWTLCARPASKISAWSRSRSASGRRRNESHVPANELSSMTHACHPSPHFDHRTA